MSILSKEIIRLVNYRINQEEYSSRIYKDMSVCMEYQGYLGAAELFKKYSKEELKHASWAYRYLLSLDVRPIVDVLEKPSNYYKDLPDAIEQAYEHEIEVTNQCKILAEASLKEGDFTTFHLAQKYLDEQVNELDKTCTLMDQLETFSKSPEALKLMDNEMKHLAKHYKS
jgi:ferritin